MQVLVPLQIIRAQLFTVADGCQEGVDRILIVLKISVQFFRRQTVCRPRVVSRVLLMLFDDAFGGTVEPVEHFRQLVRESDGVEGSRILERFEVDGVSHGVSR